MNCLMCRQPIETTKDFGSVEDEPTPIKPNTVKTYIDRRNDFIQVLNFEFNQKGKDLIIKTNTFDNFVAKLNDMKPIIQYYIRDDWYDPDAYKTKSKYVVGTSTIVDGDSEITFTDYFKFMTEEIVPLDKFEDHLINHLFQLYNQK